MKSNSRHLTKKVIDFNRYFVLIAITSKAIRKGTFVIPVKNRKENKSP